jgi:exopolysaccharide biosynthesis polyprenyl glycosylphosphotransferase
LAAAVVAREPEWEQQPREFSPRLAASPRSEVKSEPARRTLIVGAGAVGRSLAHSLQQTGKYTVVGFVDDESDDKLVDEEWSLLGKRNETLEIARRYAVDEVLIAYAPTWQQQLIDELAAGCPEVGVRIVPSPYEALMRTGNVQSYDDIALVKLSFGAGKIQDAIKRLFDILLAVFGLVVFAPLMLAITLVMKAFAPGPALFKQERIGYQGKPFTLYKFRTMVVNAEAKTGPVFSKGDNDPRVHPLGRWMKVFRVDEMPQLWNVLLGEMSFVGPRPERPFFVEQFEQMVPAYAKRHNVKPGITGLAQVCGGYYTDARDKLRFDLIYVSHHSLWMDFQILMRTFLAVFRAK